MSDIRSYSRNQALVEQRRLELLHTAARVFARNGYHRTTTRQLADACGMGSGTMYHYLGSKSDILRMMLDYSVVHIYGASESFVETLRPADPAYALAETIRYLSRLLAEYHDLHNVLNQEMVHLQSGDQELFLNLALRRVTMFEKLLNDGVKAGVFKVSDVSHAAQVISYLVTMWVRRYLLLKGRYTLEQHADQLTLEILRMLGVPDENVRAEGKAITLCD
ncbi:MAG: TetR/AcrR family transcriptional regulator [Dehalococcoidia bacterium]|nr:TetR/AcrR family transcriptional regulator [Dehalococcoidia bacterium]